VAAGAERFRPAFVVSCICVSVFVLPTSATRKVDIAGFHAGFRMVLLIGVVAGALLAQWLAGEQMLPNGLTERFRRRRLAREALATA
jgi:hypothetical protein